MEYEVYKHKDATDEEFKEITEFFRKVLIEDKDLCNGAQKNLEAGIFLNGELHPRVEKVRAVMILPIKNLLSKKPGTDILFSRARCSSNL